jgi:outer membrane receptor for ferrienterochelin and colicins
MTQSLARRRTVIVVTAIAMCGWAATAAAQDSCEQMVEQAKRFYDSGNFDRVLTLTESCLDDRETREEALAMRARTLVVLDRDAEAERLLGTLLALNAQFAPASDDSRRFVAIVARMKRELARSTTSSVSKMNESVAEAPATVVVVTAEQIRRRGYIDLEQLLHDLPGFDISRTSGQEYANIYQRGYRSDSTNRTLFIVDGVEQNDLHSNVAHLSRQYPLSNIDRVEVVYGPSSTMYGANAFLGVINVITKDPEDLVREGHRFGGEVNVGGGSWSSSYVDATVAGKFREATFSLTGRAYRSDDWDLSRFPQWSYGPQMFSGRDSDDQYVKGVSKVRYNSETFFRESPLGPEIATARRLDQTVVNQFPGGGTAAYSDLTDDWGVSAKLKLPNLQIGFDAWRQREGAVGSATAFREPGAANGNVWIPYQTSTYARYTGALSGNVKVSYFGQAKVQGLGDGSKSFTLYDYLDGPLDLDDLRREDLPPVQPFWAETRMQTSSIQFRNELNFVYSFRNRLNAIAGVDLRNGSIQADYAKATNCQLDSSSPFEKFSPANAAELVDRLKLFTPGNLFSPFVDRLLAVLNNNPRAVTRCGPAEGVAPAIKTGGEHYAVRDTGVFFQTSYQVLAPLKLVAGLRIDNEKLEAATGFGTIATPRLSAVYQVGGYVLKAIFAEAFKDPSSADKFSTTPGIRDTVNPQLETETARNLEFSVGRKWPRFSADLSIYRTLYSNLITLRTRNIAEYRGICTDFNDDRTCGVGPAVDVLNELVGVLFDEDPAPQKRALAATLGAMTPKAFDYFLKDPIVGAVATNAGEMRITGAQASATADVGALSLFGNYTYTSPYNIKPTDDFGDPLEGISRLRVGDIASHHLNLGVDARWKRFDGDLRINVVSSRRTGKDTTAYYNPLTSVPGYAVTNGALLYDFGHGVAAQLIVNNLFNASYKDPGVAAADGVRFASSVPQPGRSAFLRLLTRF